jgi:hypothetical protein
MNLSPVKLLALARLLAASDKGETEKNLSKDLKPLVEHRWEGADWADRLGEVLDELESAGAFTRIKKGKTTRLALTAEGRRLALEALGVDELPPKTTWAKLKSSYLPAIALGRPGPVGADLKVEILRARYGLDLGDGKPSMPQATEKMAAKLLGLEAGQKFTADNILRKLLRDAGIEIPAGQKPGPSSIRDALFRRELGDPSAKKPLDLLATRSVGARQNTATELASAVLRSWVDRSEPEPESHPAPIDLEDFSRRVTLAARESPSGWFGDAKVFISHVWRALRDDPAFRGVDDAAFKDRLVEAHRARLLELGRADLVEAMDPIDVRESATPYLNAVYHFVRTEETAR